jgi:hypothetical protein
MALAATYALGDYLHRDWLLIPRMASTHGLLNGLGFVMFGLLGWLVEFASLAAKLDLTPSSNRWKIDGGERETVRPSRFASHQSNLGSSPDTSEASGSIGN